MLVTIFTVSTVRKGRLALILAVLSLRSQLMGGITSVATALKLDRDVRFCREEKVLMA